MRGYQLAGLAVGCAVALAAGSAEAACMTKAAKATAGTADSAKWYALETMVQSVSWGIWPAYVANGSTPGYKIASQKYKCGNEGEGGVTCHGVATFCSTGK